MYINLYSAMAHPGTQVKDQPTVLQGSMIMEAIHTAIYSHSDICADASHHIASHCTLRSTRVVYPCMEIL
jgi:hypothetical protein